MEERALKTSVDVNAVVGALAVKTPTGGILILMIQELPNRLNEFKIYAIIFSFLILLVSCGGKSEIIEASKNFVYRNHDNATIESVTIGEGDSSNVYVTVKFTNSAGLKKVIVLLLVKNEAWTVSKPVEEYRYE